MCTKGEHIKPGVEITITKTEKEAAQFQDEFGEWVADAINEKLNKH